MVPVTIKVVLVTSAQASATNGGKVIHQIHARKPVSWQDDANHRFASWSGISISLLESQVLLLVGGDVYTIVISFGGSLSEVPLIPEKGHLPSYKVFVSP